MRWLMMFNSLACCSYWVYKAAGTNDESFSMAYKGRGTQKKPLSCSGSSCVLQGVAYVLHIQITCFLSLSHISQISAVLKRSAPSLEFLMSSSAAESSGKALPISAPNFSTQSSRLIRWRKAIAVTSSHVLAAQRMRKSFHWTLSQITLSHSISSYDSPSCASSSESSFDSCPTLRISGTYRTRETARPGKSIARVSPLSTASKS